MLKWTQWQVIGDSTSQCEWPGVYQIRLTDSGCPVPVGRLGGIDNLGLLVIGKSVNVTERIKAFNRAWNYFGLSHPAGEKRMLYEYLNLKNPGKGVYGNREIQFCAAETERGEEDRQEAKLLAGYFNNYAELPPLNSILPSWNVLRTEIKRLQRS